MKHVFSKIILMLIKEEIRKDWENALELISAAEKLREDGAYQEVINQVDSAVLSGINAIKKLSVELKSPELEDKASIVIYDWGERAISISQGKRHPTTKETIEFGFKLLNNLYDAVPLGALKPLK